MLKLHTLIFLYGSFYSWTTIDAKIVDRKKLHKIMPTNKESSVEDRLQDSIIGSAISRAGQSKGLRTFVQDPDGFWVEYKEPDKPTKLNHIHGHSMNSDEKLTRIVQKTFDELWNPLDDILRSEYPEDYRLPLDNPQLPLLEFNHHTDKSHEHHHVDVDYDSDGNVGLIYHHHRHDQWGTKTTIRNSSLTSKILVAIIAFTIAFITIASIILVYRSKIHRIRDSLQISPTAVIVKPRTIIPTTISTVPTTDEIN